MASRLHSSFAPNGKLVIALSSRAQFQNSLEKTFRRLVAISILSPSSTLGEMGGGVVMFNELCLAFLTVGMSQTPGGTGNETARVTVHLPAAARLYVDGILCPLTSDTRAFDTPPLRPGRDYAYILKAELVRDGQTVTNSKRVLVRSGETSSVDFGDMRSPDAEVSAAIPPSPLRLPMTAPPQYAQAGVDKTGKVELRMLVFETVPQTQMRTRMVDGKPVSETYTTMQERAKQVVQSVDFKELEVFGVDGKRIDSPAVLRKLKNGPTVLLSFDHLPDPTYLQIYKDGTLVFVVKPKLNGVPPMSPPPPLRAPVEVK